MISRKPIEPNRVRRIGDESFAFIPHRFLRDGFLSSLAPDQRSLYIFLVLAADRNGISYYGYDRICSVLELTVEEYIDARNGLIDQDLIAFDSRRFQVLSLPESPVSPPPALGSKSDFEDQDPATIRCLVRDVFGEGR